MLPVYVPHSQTWPSSSLRDWSHPSILFYKTGSLASFTAPPLYPGHYQVLSAVPSKYLWIISVPSYCDLQVQGAPDLLPVLLQMQIIGPLTFEAWTSLLCSVVLSRVENNKKSDNVILYSREHFQDFPKSFSSIKIVRTLARIDKINFFRILKIKGLQDLLSIYTKQRTEPL